MSSPHSAPPHLSDDQLLAEVKRLVTCERQATAALVGSLAALDERRLYLREGYDSLFSYCTRALGLSEDAAYARIEAARACRRFPVLLERLASGAITLTGVKLLARHLTPENHEKLLDAARGRSKREIEQLVVSLQPRPDVPSSLRKLPSRQAMVEARVASPASPATFSPASGGREPVERVGSPLTAATACSSGSAACAAARADRSRASVGTGTGCAADRGNAVACTSGPRASTADPCASATRDLHEPPEIVLAPPPVSRPAVVAPLAPGRYKLVITIGADTYARLRRAQDLLRHAVPDGDLATIVDRALVLLTERLERRKWGSRHARAESKPSLRRKAARTKADTVAEPAPRKPSGDRSRPRPSPHTEAGPLAAPKQAGSPRGGPPTETGPLAAPKQAGSLRGAPPTEAGPLAACNQAGSPVAAADSPQLVPERVDLSAGKPEATRARRIPAAVRRAVWAREGGRCTYVSGTGKRCEATSRLEFHHRVPYADGGGATPEGITLLCKAHHGLETERWFGEPPGRR